MMKDYQTRQIILMRKDLRMRKGKIAAQAAHASMKVFFDRAWKFSPFRCFLLLMNRDMYFWATSSFAKICRYCESEKELIRVYKLAKAANLPCALVIDAGRTEFHGKSTPTCIAVGPADAQKIDDVIGRHPLY
jgi:peptidyl-tRNA hydrolase, PTH2 family